MGEQIDKESIWIKFRKYLRNNVANNISKIAANFGSMITTIITISLYAVKAQLDWITTVIVIMCAINPFFSIWINIIFKGKAEVSDQEIESLKQNLIFEREISEYKLRVVALKANKTWEETNQLLAEVNEIETIKS